MSGRMPQPQGERRDGHIAMERAQHPREDPDSRAAEGIAQRHRHIRTRPRGQPVVQNARHGGGTGPADR